MISSWKAAQHRVLVGVTDALRTANVMREHLSSNALSAKSISKYDAIRQCAVIASNLALSGSFNVTWGVAVQIHDGGVDMFNVTGLMEQVTSAETAHTPTLPKTTRFLLRHVSLDTYGSRHVYDSYQGLCACHSR